jgi:hypothetical protein
MRAIAANLSFMITSTGPDPSLVLYRGIVPDAQKEPQARSKGVEGGLSFWTPPQKEEPKREATLRHRRPSTFVSLVSFVLNSTRATKISNPL